MKVAVLFRKNCAWTKPITRPLQPENPGKSPRPPVSPRSRWQCKRPVRVHSGWVAARRLLPQLGERLQAPERRLHSGGRPRLDEPGLPGFRILRDASHRRPRRNGSPVHAGLLQPPGVFAEPSRADEWENPETVGFTGHITAAGGHRHPEGGAMSHAAQGCSKGHDDSHDLRNLPAKAGRSRRGDRRV